MHFSPHQLLGISYGISKDVISNCYVEGLKQTDWMHMKLLYYLHGIVPTRACADGEEHQEVATYPVIDHTQQKLYGHKTLEKKD